MKTSLHAIITGRVQGVGYRSWTVRQADKRGLAGWVRNRQDGTVEALFSGEKSAVEDILAACRTGPLAAKVTGIHATPADAPQGEGFEQRETV